MMNRYNSNNNVVETFPICNIAQNGIKKKLQHDEAGKKCLLKLFKNMFDK